MSAGLQFFIRLVMENAALKVRTRIFFKADDIEITEEGHFEKSEKFWFKFQNCIDNRDCYDDNVIMTSLCANEASACAQFTK